MNLAKKMFVGLASLLMLAVPFTANALSNVQIESATMIANVTNGDTQYQPAVNAKVDDVVKVQVWYHNKEDANSGKIAQNLKVAINLPNTPGKTQTINTTVSADNSNTVTNAATANLSLDNAYLQYIPGSAQWRHNAGTNDAPNWVTQGISDNVVHGGQVIENEQPCFNFEATVTVLARVMANGLTVTKQVRKAGETAWSTQNTANPGDTLEYQIKVANAGNTTLHNVAVGDNLPAFVTYVPGSTMEQDSRNPNGVKINSDNLTRGGIVIGDMLPGSVAFVKFQAKVQPNMQTGCTTLHNVGVAKSNEIAGIENYANTQVCVNQPTPPAPVTPQQQLPQTGAETAALGFGGVTGSAGIGYAVTAYRKSKRALTDALRNVR